MMLEKKRKETRREGNASQETKREQKNKEKIKLHFICWESTRPHLPSPTSHLEPPTAQHIHTPTLTHIHPHEQISRSVYTPCCSMKHLPDATDII
jgi:hypothetical protein